MHRRGVSKQLQRSRSQARAKSGQDQEPQEEGLGASTESLSSESEEGVGRQPARLEIYRFNGVALKRERREDVPVIGGGVKPQASTESLSSESEEADANVVVGEGCFASTESLSSESEEKHGTGAAKFACTLQRSRSQARAKSCMPLALGFEPTRTLQRSRSQARAKSGDTRIVARLVQMLQRSRSQARAKRESYYVVNS